MGRNSFWQHFRCFWFWMISTLFDKWQPSIACLSLPASMSWSAVLCLFPPTNPPYIKKIHKCIHSRFGGVTQSGWHIVSYSCYSIFEEVMDVMTTQSYTRKLQTALNDVLPPLGGRFTFEANPLPMDCRIGVVALHQTKKCTLFTQQITLDLIYLLYHQMIYIFGSKLKVFGTNKLSWDQLLSLNYLLCGITKASCFPNILKSPTS